MDNPDSKKESKISIKNLYEMIIKNDEVKSEIQSFCYNKNESEEMNINDEFTSRYKLEKKIMTTFNNKYNSHCKKKYKYIELIMYNLMFNKNTHLVTLFKDYMIWDYVDEFLKRYYYKYETKERLPKFASFYKNYLDFFCQPAFCNFFYNELIQKNREKKAELFYNENFHAKKGKETQEDEGLFEDSEESEEEDDIKNISKSKIEKTIFNETIKKKIERYSPINTSMVLPESETRLKTDQSGLLISISNENSLSDLIKYMKHNKKKSHKKNNNNIFFESKNNENNEKNKNLKEEHPTPIKINDIINRKNLKLYKKIMPKQPSFSLSNKNNNNATNKKIEKFSPKNNNNNNSNKNLNFREISDYSAKHNYTSTTQHTEIKLVKKLTNISNNIKQIYNNYNFSTNSKKNMTMAKIEKININNNNNYNNQSNNTASIINVINHNNNTDSNTNDNTINKKYKSNERVNYKKVIKSNFSNKKTKLEKSNKITESKRNVNINKCQNMQKRIGSYTGIFKPQTISKEKNNENNIPITENLINLPNHCTKSLIEINNNNLQSESPINQKLSCYNLKRYKKNINNQTIISLKKLKNNPINENHKFFFKNKNDKNLSSVNNNISRSNSNIFNNNQKHLSHCGDSCININSKNNLNKKAIIFGNKSNSKNKSNVKTKKKTNINLLKTQNVEIILSQFKQIHNYKNKYTKNNTPNKRISNLRFINYNNNNNNKKKINILSCENINNNIVNTGSNMYIGNNVNKLYNKLIIKNKKLNFNFPSNKNMKEKKQNPKGLKVSASDFDLRKITLKKNINTFSQKNILNKENNNNFTINSNIFAFKKSNIMDSNLTNFNNNIPRNHNYKNHYRYYDDKNNDSLRNKTNSYTFINNQEINKNNSNSTFIYNNINKTLNQTNIINNSKNSNVNYSSNNNNSTSENREMLLQNVNININNQININKDLIRQILNENNNNNKFEFIKKNNIKEGPQKKEYVIQNSDKKKFLSRNKNKSIEFNCLNSINSMKSNFNNTNSNINFGKGMNSGFVLVHTKDYSTNFSKNNNNFQNKNKIKLSTKSIFSNKKNSNNKMGKYYNNKNLENKNNNNYEKNEEILNNIKKNSTCFYNQK